MANDRLWEYVSNEKLTRQHVFLFSCRPFPFPVYFQFFCSFSLSFSLKNQSPFFAISLSFRRLCCSPLLSPCLSRRGRDRFALLVSFPGSFAILFFIFAFFCFWVPLRSSNSLLRKKKIFILFYFRSKI
ncbi:hypothetical protein ACOSP7_002534 [Xanthoceras sorbifolium]